MLLQESGISQQEQKAHPQVRLSSSCYVVVIHWRLVGSAGCHWVLSG